MIDLPANLAITVIIWTELDAKKTLARVVMASERLILTVPLIMPNSANLVTSDTHYIQMADVSKPLVLVKMVCQLKGARIRRKIGAGRVLRATLWTGIRINV